ncbi:MAG TPA: conjugal transfer protein TraB, partial [Pseudorhodoferax sp.]|nr:conjugal transfer protein TraB [Pseudorhodoferax sp.]
KLAENTFPVIEIDASREIDVVITKGVRIDVPMTVHARAGANRPTDPETRYLEPTDDDSY